MSVRFINRAAGTAGMVAYTNDAEIRIDSTDDKLKYFDKTAGVVRALAGETLRIVTMAVDAAIAIGSGLVVLTKGSAAAMTLAAPTTAQLGTRLTITSGSAFAHVVTATGLIDDGVTGGSKSTMTFAAFVGASITLVAVQVGKWMVESKNGVTIT